MRYELSDYEWTAIKPMLPNKPRGVRRVNDRRVLNGIFWVLRSGAPWRDLPETYGPRTTCYNRFVRWRRAGVWDQIMDALAAGHDVRTRIRPISDVIGWRDVTDESTAADKPAADKPAADTVTTDKPAADKVGSDKSSDDVSAQGP